MPNGLWLWNSVKKVHSLPDLDCLLWIVSKRTILKKLWILNENMCNKSGPAMLLLANHSIGWKVKNCGGRNH